MKRMRIPFTIFLVPALVPNAPLDAGAENRTRVDARGGLAPRVGLSLGSAPGTASNPGSAAPEPAEANETPWVQETEAPLIEDRPARRSTGSTGLGSPGEGPAARGGARERFAGRGAAVSGGRTGGPRPIVDHLRVPDRASPRTPGVSRDAAAIGGAPFLFIVSPSETGRYEFVRRHFADECDVEVVYDRRRGERRRYQPRHAVEQRQGERRRNHVAQDLRAVGWAYVRRPA